MLNKISYFFLHEDVQGYIIGSISGAAMFMGLEQHILSELLKFTLACTTAFACGFFGMAGKNMLLWATTKVKNVCKK